MKCQKCGETDPSKFKSGNNSTCRACINLRRKERWHNPDCKLKVHQANYQYDNKAKLKKNQQDKYRTPDIIRREEREAEKEYKRMLREERMRAKEGVEWI